MAQPATRACAEPNTGNKTCNENIPNESTEKQNTCENLRNKEGETFIEWWATQIAEPSRNGIGQNWSKADYDMLWIILNAYVSSAKAAPWGCLCSGATQTETCDQQT